MKKRHYSVTPPRLNGYARIPTIGYAYTIARQSGGDLYPESDCQYGIRICRAYERWACRRHLIVKPKFIRVHDFLATRYVYGCRQYGYNFL